ncbi:MAG: thioredoxin family protein [Burkholderiales bacterium]
MTIRIEVISAPGCGKCATARDELRSIAMSVFGDRSVTWREVDVIEELPYAISLGVLNLPAIAVNGELLFASLPTPEQFRGTLSGLKLP